MTDLGGAALVTGGSGFLGRHLLIALRAAGIPSEAPPSAAWDVRNEATGAALMTRIKPSLIFHLAAFTDPVRAEREPALARSVNLEGALAVARAAAAAAPGARLVLVSTCHVYGPPQRLPVGEDHPLLARGAYARSKADADEQVRALADAAGLDLVVARPFNLTGPGQHPASAPADWARRAAEGAAMIRVGDLSPERDYMDVRDGAEGLLVLARRGERGGVYNLCSGRAVTMRWILETVAPGVPWEVDPTRLRPAAVPALVGDPSRAAALGWSARRPVAGALSDLRASLS